MSNGFFADEDEAVTDATTERMIRQRAAEMVRGVLNEVFAPTKGYLTRAWAVGFVFGASWTYEKTVAGVCKEIGINRNYFQGLMKELRDRFGMDGDNLRGQSNAAAWRERKRRNGNGY
jgi:hypothetical protein